jgi:predicted RNA-binding protein YlqC (UPF0109 family)
MNELKHSYAPLFRRYAEGIIYKPSFMQIKEVNGQNFVHLLVNVHASDIGLICGAGGSNIRAIQTIFGQIARHRGEQIRISIDKVGERQRIELSQPDQNWSRSQEALELVEDTVKEMGCKVKKAKFSDMHDTTIITIETNVPKHVMEAVDVAIRAWGKSLGRRILVVNPDQVVTA